MTLHERFWQKVVLDRDSGCWIWTGARRSSDPARGYGMVWAGGKNRSAAQVAWELTHGEPFPEGMLACHTCDNPPCVNPAHIFPGSMSDNLLDAAAKGRIARGAAISHARLTPEIVREIRTRSQSNAALGREYGVGKSTIKDARNGKSWRHVE